ncbi:MAG: macro domain-containing protein [Candidatus Marithrix sp.]
MFKRINSFVNKHKLKIIKPFTGKSEYVTFSICGYTSEISLALLEEFLEIDQVEIVEGDIFALNCTALVSSANSFGDMSGGLDKIIDNFYQNKAQPMIIKAIQSEFFGELPVGNAVIINMKAEKFPNLIVSPTMRIPGNIEGTINVYLAMRALLVALAKYNSHTTNKIQTVAIPSLGTGIGGMSAKESARQMKTAFKNIVLNGWQEIKHPAMAPYAINL